ncbi:hypothetical protein EF096_17405 [Pseudomonas neustonica]|uniref:Uncharacterized protein n=1 Tax=Pseudomonas neustonica TaxID=2487346 RepID=A0ABX9XDZ1_9PSED|nr:MULTISPECIES: hypothetical protein [Pseudomonas]ROZ81570.1 hypothetical protein EF096_17405 [Pseudomonas neustonica]ROZ84219.1 hypothetical protein EF099_07860 [Pseudomonas sp. SSM44]
MRLIVVAFACVLFTAQLAASEQPKLFKTWAYKAPMTLFSEAQGFYDCAADFGGKAVCSDDVEFVGGNFGAVLIPMDGQLAQVTLVSEFDNDLYIKAIGALANGFTMVSMRGASDQLDMVESIHTSQSIQQFQSRINDYETLNLNQGQLTYTFIEQPPEVVRRFRTAHALASGAPDTARTAELIVMDNAEHSVLMVKFTLPKLFLESARESVQQLPVEDF